MTSYTKVGFYFITAWLCVAFLVSESASVEQLPDEDVCNTQACMDHGIKADFLIQANQKRTHKVEATITATLGGVWSATSYGDCCGDSKSGTHFRTVTCVETETGDTLDESRCTGPHPGNSDSCDCGVEICSSRPCQQKAVRMKEGGVPTPSDFEKIGCFETTLPLNQPKLRENTSEEDLFCMNSTSVTPCNYGLPFYYHKMQTTDEAKCAALCIDKALDIFGVFRKSSVCRCGASRANTDMWHKSAPRLGLAFDSSALTPNQDSACDLEVFRYNGYFDAGRVPIFANSFHEGDLAYLDSITQGHQVGEEIEEDGVSAGTSQGAANMQVDEGEKTPVDLGTGWERGCWPRNCLAGPDYRGNVGPWRTRVTSPPAHDSGDWAEYVVVNYYFEAGVDDDRKQVMRAAAAKWRQSTCINLVEHAGKYEPEKGYVKVGMAGAGCYVTGVGWPGQFWHPTINMGWCNSMMQIGSVIHEIGHIVGMNHEMKRADAGSDYKGKPQNLVLHWENIGWNVKSQYLPDASSYIGSKNDGFGDPVSGFAPYDFGSIMHYSSDSGQFDTIPPEKEQLVGTRNGLAPGDIEQILDVYQCKPRGMTAPPSPAFPSHFFTVTGDCTKDEVTGCLTSKNWPLDYGNDEMCTVSLGYPKIRVVDFNTELYDKFTVNGIDHMGNMNGLTRGIAGTFPEGLTPTTEIVWSSNQLHHVRSGWKICPDVELGPDGRWPSPTPVPPTPAPPPFQAVLSGACTQDSSGCVMSKNYPEAYGNNEHCRIAVGYPTIDVVAFNTENSDILAFGYSSTRGTPRHNQFSNSGTHGSLSLQGLTPTTDIVWSSDHSDVRTGWKICPKGVSPSPTEPPTASPTQPPTQPPTEPPTTPTGSPTPVSPTPAPPPTAYVVSGDCTKDSSGCVMSKNFPQNYESDQHCVITAGFPTINVIAFNTEYYDKILVNDIEYSRSTGPQGVTPTTDIVWSSDGSVNKQGWKICPQSPTGSPTPVPPTPAPPPTPYVVSGDCTKDSSGCVMSKNFPENYESDQHCVITVGFPTIDVRAFNTEYYDKILVNDIKYSGSTGPQGVTPTTDIVWSSDFSTNKQGWKICPQ